MPSKANNAIHFISGGDCGVNSAAISNNIQAARQDPMFAIVGGDLGYDNGRSVDVSLAFLRNYSRTMIGRDGRLIPMITCIGNMEVDGSYGKAREKATSSPSSRAHPETGYARSFRRLSESGAARHRAHKPDRRRPDVWLEDSEGSRRSSECLRGESCAVLSVLPQSDCRTGQEGFDAKPGTGELQRKNWVPLFDRFRVPVVLEHHDHTFKPQAAVTAADDNGVLYLGDGSWGRCEVRN